ncbi:hypothetical protein ISN45_Aa05g004560 [Arabidopsis thaliana x Arabidopsis arenosa]|uniref:Uncharacterized protein n=1 Tax=Arabidopsis thaliana x Arabidopsis arenosa TaxID=1240361 RepID=A0A8T1ZI27_9BRAS|nr:hypothetical protein ISN45_Aa05g004560 [Arabidopsis thaliana x Arabidopsis arenosa]
MVFSITYDSDSSDYSLSGGEEQADASIGDGSSSRQEQEQSDSNENGGDSSDSHSLINEIVMDNSIDYLIRCSWSDYGSITSLNRNCSIVTISFYQSSSKD